MLFSFASRCLPSYPIVLLCIPLDPLAKLILRRVDLQDINLRLGYH